MTRPSRPIWCATLPLLVACPNGEGDSATDTADTATDEVTDYEVLWSTDPSPLVAGQEGSFTLQVVDQLGRPVEDLQQTHERMAHTAVVSQDLSSFQHLHQEDFTAITADNLRNATFSFPLTVPLAGDYLLAFDFAHHNQWLVARDTMTATGSPAMGSPDLTLNDTASDGGLTATLTWEVPAVGGYEANWSVTIVDEGGEEVTDIVPYLGADAHCFVGIADLTWSAHTHAWYPGMEAMTPSMSMAHVYDGPYLPFHYVFPVSGTYKMWVQFTRASAPDTVFVLPFVFVVS